jgi:transposase-like protein
LLSQRKSVSQTCKQIGVSDQTYYRWRKIYGGMKVDQARRLTAHSVAEREMEPTIGLEPMTCDHRRCK